jgi:hypothetical protein
MFYYSMSTLIFMHYTTAACPPGRLVGLAIYDSSSNVPVSSLESTSIATSELLPSSEDSESAAMLAGS